MLGWIVGIIIVAVIVFVVVWIINVKRDNPKDW
jgi:hypothetical protein